MAAGRTVAVIPARGGSKGIPGKNLRRVGGLSLVARSVLAAGGCPDIDAVIVSTDDPGIAAEARRHGAQVIERPADIAGDVASSESALVHVLDQLAARDEAVDVLVFLQCTSPFTSAADIDAVLEPVRGGEADCAFSAAPFHGFLWAPGANSSVGINHDETLPRRRRQDRPVELRESGAVYVMDVPGFRVAGSRFFGRIRAVEIDAQRSMEIDDPADLELARAMAARHVGGTAPFAFHMPPQLIALDFDGVFTDNTVIVMEDGREGVIAHRGDGHGISRLRDLVPVVVFSTELNPVVAARCAKLRLRCEQGLGDRKADALRTYAETAGIPFQRILYVGNDVNDLDCMQLVGTAVAVADADRSVLAASDLVLERTGGHGALRELCDMLIPLYDSPMLYSPKDEQP